MSKTLGANQPLEPIPFILTATATMTGFLNTGLKRLLKSSQSLLVRHLALTGISRRLWNWVSPRAP
jgi:hypothetical protein